MKRISRSHHFISTQIQLTALSLRECSYYFIWCFWSQKIWSLIRSSWIIFVKQIIVLFWVINYSYFQRFFKIGVFKTLYTIHRKTTVSESLFNEPLARHIFKKGLQHRCFLAGITKLSRTAVSQEHLETPDSVFMQHIWNYKIIKFYVS